MKRLSIPTLAVALTATLVTPGCNPKVTEIRGETVDAAMTAIGQEEQTKDCWFEDVAEAYEKGGNRVKAKEMWLKYAQQLE